jgi:hypothetical protein
MKEHGPNCNCTSEEIPRDEVESLMRALNRIIEGRKTPIPVALAALVNLIEMAKMELGVEIEVHRIDMGDL